MPCPLAGRGPGDIDIAIVRENTEGEYSSVGGVMFEGTPREFVLQEAVFTRHGTERVLRYAFELARTPRAPPRHRRHQEQRHRDQHAVVGRARRRDGRAVSRTSAWDKQHIDILCARFVMQPQRFDVVVASNLFGDILSDLGPACTGTIGLAPSANINPERLFPSLFEPVHGSAPDIAGRNIANPVAMIWSAALMLDFLGRGAGAREAGARRDLRRDRARARERPAHAATSAARPRPPTSAPPSPRGWGPPERRRRRAGWPRTRKASQLRAPAG